MAAEALAARDRCGRRDRAAYSKQGSTDRRGRLRRTRPPIAEGHRDGLRRAPRGPAGSAPSRVAPGRPAVGVGGGVVPRRGGRVADLHRTPPAGTRKDWPLAGRRRRRRRRPRPTRRPGPLLTSITDSTPGSSTPVETTSALRIWTPPQDGAAPVARLVGLQHRRRREHRAAGHARAWRRPRRPRGRTARGGGRVGAGGASHVQTTGSRSRVRSGAGASARPGRTRSAGLAGVAGGRAPAASGRACAARPGRRRAVAITVGEGDRAAAARDSGSVKPSGPRASL